MNGLLAGAVGAVTIEVFLLVVFRLLNLPLIRLNQSDAAHLIGKSAHDGGIATALLGFGLHFLVSLAWGLIASALMQRVDVARKRPVAFGMLFGVVVMIVMNWIVLPLNREPFPNATPRFLIVMLLAHTIFFGIPVALTLVSARARVPSRSTT